MTLGLFFATLAVVASVYTVATKTGDAAYLWHFTWYFADAFAIVLAGTIVRTLRSGAAARPSMNKSVL